MNTHGNVQIKLKPLESICFGLAPSILNKTLRIEILPFFRSDHKYICLEFSIPRNQARGRGTWKLNFTHLKDQQLHNLIKDFWFQWQLEKNRFPSLTVWCDAGKKRLKNISQDYSKQDSRYIKLKGLHNEISLVNEQISNGLDKQSDLNNLQSQLEHELL